MKIVKVSAALLMGLFVTLALAGQVATAQPGTAPAQISSTDAKPITPFTYAWVITANVPVYANPGDVTPIRTLGAGFL